MFGYVLIGLIAGVASFLGSYLFFWSLLPALFLSSIIVSVVTVLAPVCLSSGRPNAGCAGGRGLNETGQNGAADA